MKTATQPEMFRSYPDVLSVKDVSEILATTRRTVYSLIEGGELFARRVGKGYRVSKHSLISYLTGDEAHAV